MPKKKILLAPNSFKECADSVKVVDLLAKYLSKCNVDLLKYPISDGGDGFLNSLIFNFDLKELTYSISTPYDDSKFNCPVLYDELNKKIFIESAKVLGLQIIPEEKRHPLYLSSKGLGELLKQINRSINTGKLDVNNLIIGIGGTGTNDLGIGICKVFGLKLTDKYGKNLDILPVNYSKVENIIWSKPKLNFKIECIVDVFNPLLGEKGATKLFAKQKGATEEEVELLEAGFTNICNILNNNKLYDLMNSNYGAGGGLAAGLSIFFNAKIKSAFDSLINNKKLIKKMEQADIIVTGEGKFDKTSLIGKGASAVLNLTKKMNKKIILCCGQVEENIEKELSENIQVIKMNKYSDSSNYRLNFEKEVENASNKIIQALI
ncbi:MAG: hypothetical protein COW08_07645 [Ignavibacteriales bacterium CG12_big_fil_rev_8_21_14_0_65_30_8]|nr:MAG: hypothetical protein COW08_07645 [Ignavibacteriales bacterium CG12_big_fil_rev_8_21_14_0_65_30_8]